MTLLLKCAGKIAD